LVQYDLPYAGSAGASPLRSWNGASYSGVTGPIARGYAFREWTGSGLMAPCRQPLARSGVATLVVAEAAETLFITGNETALWGGQTVDATTVVVKYTYAGDVNLAGVIDGADYCGRSLSRRASSFLCVLSPSPYSETIASPNCDLDCLLAARQEAPPA
jgi:hypothetical protein